MPRRLSDQIIVITGASSGIGRETALEFARRGARVVLAARNEKALLELKNHIERFGAAVHVVGTDVAEWPQVARLAQAAVARFGRIDTWVNNAAVSEYANIEEMEIDEIDRILHVDLHGPIYGCKAAIPHMKRGGGGVLINVGSALSDRAVPLQGIYSAAKHGLKGFTEALRMELLHSKSNIQVTLILPAAVNTPFYDHARNRTGHKPKPLGPVYDPHAVAEAILFAAEHPRRDIYVGAAAKMLSLAEQLSPPLVDQYMTRGARAFKAQLSDHPNGQRDNLFTPIAEAGRSHGQFGRHAHRSSLYTRLFEFHPALAQMILFAAAAGALAMLQHMASRPARQRIRMGRSPLGLLA